MKEIIRFWLLNRVIKNTTLTAEIYQMMYNHRTFVRPVETLQQPFFPPKIEVKPVLPTISSVAVQTSTSNRRKEMMAALSELKSKTIKTKQDKDSIGILEAALKNVN